MIDHSDHGRGTREEGPDDPDCPCRGTKDEWDCGHAGCGFCLASAIVNTQPMTKESGLIFEILYRNDDGTLDTQ